MLVNCKSKWTPFFLIVLIVLIGNSSSFADGEGRPATPQEKAFYKSVISAFDKAIPHGPSGWKEIQRPNVAEMELQYVGIDCGKAPFFVGYVRVWEDEARINAAVAAGQQEVTDQPQLTNLSAGEKQSVDRLGQLADELTAAMNKGDQARIVQIQAEMEKTSVNLGATENVRENEGIKITTKNSLHDVRLEVGLNANDFDVVLDRFGKKETSIAGGLVIRTEGCIDGDYHTWVEGTTTVFLGGNWRVANDGSLHVTAEPDKRVSYTTVQTIVITVYGDSVRARKCLEAIDWKAVKGLLGK